MNFKTKARGDQAHFLTDCCHCGGELTISNGKPEAHNCKPFRPVTLADIRAALDERG